jgi:predicted transcriptional regulator|tara:strand:- start:125 stop:505 length:381 start_codon:yes stop_codon:yes gene_type:complete
MKETGRPKFQPTEENERICSLGVGFGLNHEQIAKLVGCSPKTLRKHFSHALDTGKERLIMSLGTKLYSKAMKGDTVSAIFLAKTKGGFQEKVEHEGLPNQISVSFSIDPPKEENIIEGEVVTKRIE